MRLTLRGREAQLRGVAQELSAFRLYSAERPFDVEASEGEMLAELPVVGYAIENGWLRFTMRGDGSRLGQARWFQAFAADGGKVLDGTVGRTDGDLAVPIDTIQPGSPVTITAALAVAP